MGNRIAVVTPYYKESIEMLRQCHESVLKQAGECDHFLIADGFPKDEVAKWKAKHITLPQANGDNGNTPRSVGGIVARAQGYEFVAYLDADNWFHPNHLVSLLSLWEESQAPVCCSQRTFHRPDGQEIVKLRDSDEDNLSHVDTSCYLLHRSAFECLDVWHQMPKQLSPVCDRVFFRAVKYKRFNIAFSKKRTVAFRTLYAMHYISIGLPPPPNAKGNVFKESLQYLSSATGVRESIERLGFWPGNG